jgi:hypothetical protein
MTTLYRIVDEPRPSAWAKLAVDPIWPLLAMMIAGLWTGAIWFVVNSMAIGSATLRREVAMLVAGIVTLVVVAFVLAMLAADLPRTAIPYVLLVFPALKALLAYLVCFRQASSFEIHVAYGGAVAPGFLGLAACLAANLFIGPALIELVVALDLPRSLVRLVLQ